MPDADLDFDHDEAIARLMRFLAVEGVTGQEAAIGREVVAVLTAAGIPRRAIRFDDAHQRIPLPTETGNLIVTLPGTVAGPRRLFMTHLDTVPLCAGARPVRKGNRIVAAGKTALGGDDRTGVACLATVAATLQQRQLPHPPLTFLFTVREESGLWGARYVDLADLEHPAEGFNADGRSPAELTVGAVGADSWEVEITGRAAHAGVHPEQGISATLVAALALADIFDGGWFGKVRRDGKEGTSNVGVFGGPDGRSAGVATNVVTDYVRIEGESRSHDMGFCKAITSAYREAFRAAGTCVRDDRGRRARVRFRAQREYYPFRLKPTAPVVRHALAAAEKAGVQPRLRVGNGGLDANWMVRHGLPTVTFGAGQNNIHAIGEYVELADFTAACRLGLALATLETV
ncbi:MAG TPA: M20/M25/M40 family metallo-hydrolase [Gemmataceae bacterium]|jgi:tripeptide aminopeptidase|nr:M20/M25/M40 family metallo-hydrolase [Gemmataceae bacterium]